MSRITKNFSEWEFACPCGCGTGTIDHGLVKKLQTLRNKVGKITITSGLRCVEHNVNVGGRPRSQHLLGKAADITLDDRSNRSMSRLYICSDLLGFKGIGLYARRIHVDVRTGPKVRWIDGSWSWSDT